jgi:cell wall-associated NlpC family hydrolase
MAGSQAPATPDVNIKLGGSSPVIPLTIIGVGAWLAWFGVQYWRSDVKYPTDPIKAILTGKPLPPNTKSTPTLPSGPAINPNAPGTVPANGPLGNQIATAAQEYIGAGYVWGGVADKPGNWDCSSFVSYVLGHDIGLYLPGTGADTGSYGDPGYPPHAHGPGSTAYMLYGQGINLADVAPGDLVVSTEHMGIAISATEMVAAIDPQNGTAVQGFPAGFPAGPPVYRRLVTSYLKNLSQPAQQM